MKQCEFSAKDVAMLLKEVENDCLKASFRKRDIARLKLESQKPLNTEIKHRENHLSKEDYPVDYYDEDFEFDVALYLEALTSLKDNFTLEDIIDILPSKDDYSYLRINYRLQCEIIKSIKSIMDASKHDKDFLELLPDEKKKLQFLKDAMAYEEENVISENTCNKIILVPNLSGNISIIDDVERLPYDIYDDVIELINSIIDGTFKRNKSFTQFNDLSGICEVRKGDLRVIYTRINSDTYAILTTFSKKIYTDQYYRDNMNRKANNYRSVEKMIKDNLDNPDFIRENDLQVQRLFSILRREDATDMAKVLEKRDNNE